MVAFAFDTLKFTPRLESSGLPREQAIGITEAFVEAHYDGIENQKSLNKS
jgi:hypothetical protein